MTDRPVSPKPQGQHRAAPTGFPGRLRNMMSDSLVRNSGYLIGNLAFTAGCGLFAVSLLTRLYSTKAVGLAAVAVSAGGLIDKTTQFGLTYSLPRFLPTSRHRAALINTVLTVTMLAAFLGAVIVLVLPISAKLYALGGWVFPVVFLAGTTMSCGQTHLGVIFVSDRATKKLAKANMVANLVNLAAPAAFSFAGMLGAYLSKMALGLTSFILMAIMLGRSGHRFRPTLSVEATRDLRGFAAGAYVASLVGMSPVLVIPMIILARFGPTENAYWYAAMGVAGLLNGLPSTISGMLLSEAAHRPLERQALVRRAALLMGVLTVPAYVVAYVAAPLGLALFGHRYAVGSLGSLRWLIVGGLVTQVNYLTGNILYLAKKTFAITLVNGIYAVIVLGLALTWARNASDVAIAWIIGDGCNVVLFAVLAFAALREVRGRWECLGGEEPAALEGAARQRVTRESQEAALDMLRRLAALQITGPTYVSSQDAALDMLRRLAALQATGPVHVPGDLSANQCDQQFADDRNRTRDRRPRKGAVA